MKIIFAFALPVWLAAAVFANPALHGTWSAPNVQGRPLKVDFSSDGSGKINDAPMRWQAVGGTLFIQQNGQVASYGFKVDGDKLHVSGGDLAQPATLTKGAVAASGNGQELVGKWCDVRSMSNYQGGSSSMACFELKLDGTYTYHAESSRSVSAGSTASQSTDSGRWSYKGGQLVAQSRSGQTQTYNLEKRNHPKNKRDPMICLNGACYVTFYNKPAW
ncbi:MAG TPA: hypothetical protein VNU64_08190 [Burkholderiales bacterium]|nr:hypothetical protein [Burkholderiales bacterium]